MFIEIRSTTPSKDLAQKISNAIINTRLAACVQISGPIQSIYMWKGKVNQDEEYLISVKTLEKNFSEIEKLILKLHEYETPEIIFHEIKGNHEYLEWIKNQSNKSGQQ